MAKWVPSILLFLIAAGLAVLGLLQIKAGRQAARMGAASLMWPKVTGRVTASAVRSITTGSGEYVSTHHIPEVGFTYTVAGQDYVGSRIAFRDLRGMKRSARKLVNKYPAGAAIEVSYDPQAPQDSVLEPGSAGVSRSFLWAAIMLVVAAGIAIAGIVVPIFHLY